MMAIAIIGAGGMARDALAVLHSLGLASRVSGFYESEDYWSERTLHSLPVRPLGMLDSRTHEVVVAIGNGDGRRAIVSQLPAHTRYPTFFHPSVIQGNAVRVGSGVLVCAGTVMTTDIHIGDHAQINVSCSLTHECSIGDYTTLSPGVRLSGNCQIGRNVFIGTGACLRERTTVVDNAVIGMGAIVVSSIMVPGTYTGCPAKIRPSCMP